MTTTWKVVSLLTHKHEDGYSDVVHMVSWLCEATDGTNVARVGGDTEVDPPTAPFIPYAELTETTILGWVTQKLGARAAATEQSLADQLVYIANPPLEVLPLPWA